MHNDGAYIINRGRKKRRNSGAGRSAGILIAALLFLTAAICLLVVFLPRLTLSMQASQSASLASVGKTYYFLCTEQTDERTSALLSAQNTRERGGAGYLYNDGKYKVIAAVYKSESDVKTLVTVNPNSFYFSLSVAGGKYSGGDREVLNYLTGEWFDTLSLSATELDRGNTTEDAAEYAAFRACEKLRGLALNASSEKLKSAILSCEYSPPQTQSVLSYIRYVHVRYIVAALCALS